MSTIKDNKFIAFAETKITDELLRFSKGSLSYEESEELAKIVVGKIDWNNSALMHKGISWIAKNYLNQMNLLRA